MKLSQLSAINIISWLQIIGGITGLGLIAYLLLQTDVVNGPGILIFSIGVILFIYSIYTGKILFYDQNKRKGIILTIINQLLQIMQWNVLGYGISYSSGVELLIGIKGGAANFNISILTSTFKMSIHSQDASYVSLNLAAVVIIVVSARCFNKIEELKKSQEYLTPKEGSDYTP
jgi:hypothetical protein